MKARIRMEQKNLTRLGDIISQILWEYKSSSGTVKESDQLVQNKVSISENNTKMFLDITGNIKEFTTL